MKQVTAVENKNNSIREVGTMAKRKAERDAAVKYSKTPKKNVNESEFSAEFSAGEETMKGFNRNSKQGRKGRS